jgi:hypothetical protein
MFAPWLARPPSRRAGSASLDLAYVAAGRFDAFWESGLSEWDMAAGALLIQEAGGLISDFTGSHEFLERSRRCRHKCFKGSADGDPAAPAASLKLSFQRQKHPSGAFFYARDLCPPVGAERRRY